MDIEQIPRVMRQRHRWVKAPLLMERWFRLPPNSRPESGQPDRTTITMTWALQFQRARAAFDQMVRSRAWCDEASRRHIARWLESRHLLTSRPAAIGMRNFRSASASALTNDCICTRHVGSLLDPVDDMYGALGRFDFCAVVRGQVEPVRGAGSPPVRTRRTLRPRPATVRYQVSICEVGIYLWDSYDFNGSQTLGFWTDAGVSRVGLPANEVTNAHFREWRSRNGHGGDFVVVSDVRTIRRSPPDTFVF